MGKPVVHFEIIGNDPQNLRDYYTGVFGWEFDTPSPVAQEVSEPESYGFLDLWAIHSGPPILDQV
jgi:predicted enzyme related to lactoylglutathione lyase